MELITHINIETKRAVILNENGEIVESGRFVTETDMQNAQNQRDAYRRKLNSTFVESEGRLEHHVACFQEQMKQIIPHLSLTSCGFIISLLAKLKLNSDNVLTNNNKPMTLSDIQKYLDKSRSQTSVQLKRLTTMNILTEEKVGRCKHYRFNPEFHLMGKHSIKNEKEYFIRLYKGKLQEMIKELSLKEIGFIYKCLAVCHYELFFLVERPNIKAENNNIPMEDQLGFLNCTELATFMNEDTDTVSSVVRSLQSKGFLMESWSANSLSYRLHPHIVYPVGTVTNEKIQGICEDFLLHKCEATEHRRKKY